MKRFAGVDGPCPSMNEWELLLEEALPPERIREMEVHLESCDRCGAGIRDLSPPLPLPEGFDWGHVDDDGAGPSFEELFAVAEQALQSLPIAHQLVRPRPEPVFDRAGEYRLLSELGRGRMGIVYKAEQISVARVVAVKILSDEALRDPASADRLAIEATRLGALKHPNIVEVYSAGKVEGYPYFSMEYIDGTNLELVLKNRRYSVEQAVELVRQLALGVHSAHERNVIHRDLKPANILITDDNTPKISDFGIATTADHALLNIRGEVIGTPEYMAPEQWVGTPPVRRQTDIYGLGCILYQLLVGRPPFYDPEHNVERIRDLALKTEPESPRLLNPAVSRDLEQICLACLEKAQDLRYSNARALADDLGRVQRGEETEARRLTVPVRMAYLAARHKMSTALVALVLTAAVVFSFMILRKNRELSLAMAISHYDEGVAAMERGYFVEGGEKLARARSAVMGADSPITEFINRSVDAWMEGRPDSRTLLQAHDGLITAAAISREGTNILFGDERGRTYLIDSEHQGALPIPTESGSSRVVSVGFSPSGGHYMSATADGRIKIWKLNYASAFSIRSARSPHFLSAAVLLNDEGALALGSLAIGESHSRLSFWSWDASTEDWRPPTEFETAGSVQRLVASPDGKRLVAITSQNSTLYATDPPRRLKVLELSPVSAASFSPDGREFVLAGTEIEIYDADTGTRKRKLTSKETVSITAIQYRGSTGFSLIAETPQLGTRFRRVLEAAGVVDDIPVASASSSLGIYSSAYGDGYFAGIGSQALTLNICPSYDLREIDLGRDFGYAALAVTSDGSRIVTSTIPNLPRELIKKKGPEAIAERLKYYRSKLQIWDGNKLEQINDDQPDVLSNGLPGIQVAITRKDNLVAVGTNRPMPRTLGDSRILVSPYQQNQPLDLFTADTTPEAVSALVFDREEDHLIYATFRGVKTPATLNLVNTLGVRVARVPFPSPPSKLAVARDRDLLAVGASDSTIRLVNPSTLAILSQLTEPIVGGITALAISNDGSLLAAGTAQGNVYLIRIQNQRFVESILLTRQRAFVRGVGFDEKTTTVYVSANHPNVALSLWDLATLRQIGPTMALASYVDAFELASHVPAAVFVTSGGKLLIRDFSRLGPRGAK